MQDKFPVTFSISIESLKRFDALSARHPELKLNRSALAQQGFNQVMDQLERELTRQKEQSHDDNSQHA